MQPYFRGAVHGDLNAIASILRASSPHEVRQQTATPDSYRRALDEIDRHDGSYLLVAEYDGQIGAAVQILVYPLLAGGGGRTAEIIGLWVADEFRTSGIDAQLLDHAIARIDDLGCLHVKVLAASASKRGHSFWERSGFIHLDAGYVREVNGAARLRTAS